MPKTVNSITIQVEWMVMPMTFNGITIQYSKALPSKYKLNGNTGNVKSISRQLFKSRNTKGFLNLSEFSVSNVLAGGGGGGGVKGPRADNMPRAPGNLNPAVLAQTYCKQVVGTALSQLVDKLATNLLRKIFLTNCWNSTVKQAGYKLVAETSC
jgi:hypothetical protein